MRLLYLTHTMVATFTISKCKRAAINITSDAWRSSPRLVMRCSSSTREVGDVFSYTPPPSLGWEGRRQRERRQHRHQAPITPPPTPPPTSRLPPPYRPSRSKHPPRNKFPFQSL